MNRTVTALIFLLLTTPQLACGLGVGLTRYDLEACESACRTAHACGGERDLELCFGTCEDAQWNAPVLEDDCVDFLNERNRCIAAARSCGYDEACFAGAPALSSCFDATGLALGRG